jgi:hypothetical protein
VPRRLASIENKASRVRSLVGRVAVPGGASIARLLPDRARAQRPPERHQIVLPDLVDRAGGQIAKREGPVGGADQARDLEPEMLEHAADLAILALAEPHLDPGIAAGAALQIGVDRAIAYPFDVDPVDQLLELRLADLAEHPRAIRPLDSRGGQFELALQLAVRGEQQQPLGVEIEPADRHQPWQARG